MHKHLECDANAACTKEAGCNKFAGLFRCDFSFFKLFHVEQSALGRPPAIYWGASYFAAGITRVRGILLTGWSIRTSKTSWLASSIGSWSLSVTVWPVHKFFPV